VPLTAAQIESWWERRELDGITCADDINARRAAEFHGRHSI
jgi:hypothetical protein